MTDDQLIAAVQERLDAGAFGFNGLVSSVQADAMANFSAVCDLSAAWSNSHWDEPHVKELRELLDRLADQRPKRIEVFALNTTQLGREDHYQRN